MGFFGFFTSRLLRCWPLGMAFLPIQYSHYARKNMLRIMKLVALLLVPLVFAACSSVPRDSAEAAWQRGQCEQVVDQKLREKCLERVEKEFGRW